MARRVVVTGMDVVTPTGVGLEAFWKAVLAGTSGVRRIAHFDPHGLPTQIAAALTDTALLGALREENALDALEPRGVVIGVRAARGAVADADSAAAMRGSRAGVFVGTSGERIDLRHMGAMAYASRGADGTITPASFAREFARRVSTDRLERTLPQYLTARLAGLFGAEGPSGTIQTACTSSAQAIGEALRTIRRGAIDIALAGGAECIVSPIEMQLFSLLGVMSKQNEAPESASRPFDARRSSWRSASTRWHAGPASSRSSQDTARRATRTASPTKRRTGAGRFERCAPRSRTPTSTSRISTTSTPTGHPLR